VRKPWVLILRFQLNCPAQALQQVALFVSKDAHSELSTRKVKITIRAQNTAHIYGEKVACLRCGAARVTNNGTPADSYQTNLLPEMMWSDIPQPTRSRTAISSLFVLVKTQQINLHQQQKI